MIKEALNYDSTLYKQALGIDKAEREKQGQTQQQQAVIGQNKM
jgi:hypothetical protein